MAVPQPKGNEGQGAGLIFQGRTEAQVLAATVRCPVTPAVDAAAPFLSLADLLGLLSRREHPPGGSSIVQAGRQTSLQVLTWGGQPPSLLSAPATPLLLSREEG